MSEARWRRLEDLFHAAAALAPGERGSFLDGACAGDDGLRAEVARLLAAHERAGGFMDEPAVASVGVPARPQDALPGPAGAADPGSGTDPADAARSAGDSVAAGQRFGPYRVVREIARGGMGAVYLAERADGEFERRVALKLIKRGMDTDLIQRRFRAERRILASLEHPNIARLLDGGTSDDGRSYLVMEYIEGEPIDRYARERGLSIPERLRLFLQVCDAVSFAHARRVVHRDIKPLNVLVTPDGAPKLLDFGIARVLEPGDDEGTTLVSGARLLTPEYASPEQVDGRRATEASDIYSLGVVLYELLTGRSPYPTEGGDPVDVAHAVRTTQPERPSAAVARRGRAPRSARELRGDLDTIVLAALRKEPERRYPSVAELAEDIRRHLDGLPVRARPDTAAYRTGKFLRRHRASVLAAGVAGLTVALLVGAASLALSRRAAAGRADSLVAAGALAPQSRILVADFVDRADDPALAAALTEAFRVDLGQSPLVRVLTTGQARSALARMRLPPDGPLDEAVARELAVREGAAAFVTGAVSRVGGGYTLTAQLVAAESGEALAAARETAADSTELLAALDRTSEALRGRIGEPLRELRASPPLEQVTTASLPALRRFTAGYRLFLDGQRTRALPPLAEAVALDTGFASAHHAIASIWESLAEPGRSWDALRHALANPDRLPFLERQFMLGGHAYARGDYPGAIREYERVLERQPSFVPALNNMALAYRDGRDYATAEGLWLRATALDSTLSVLYYGLHSTQVLQARFADSRRTLDQVRRRFPEDPLLTVVEVQDAAARQAWDEAERRAAANLAAKRADTLQLVDAHEAMAGILTTRGRLAEAEGHRRAQLATSEASGAAGRHLLGVLQLAYVELRHRDDANAARALVDSSLAGRPLDVILPGDRPHHDLARFYAEVGDLPRARRLLAGADSADRELGRDRQAERSWTRGVIALGEGRLRTAEAELRRAAETHVCAICPLPDLARTQDTAGDVESAIATYERYVATPWLWRYDTDARELGPALLRLGELHERRGDTGKAIAAYAGLLRLWDRAEGKPAREAEAVRRRLETLRRPGG